MSFVNVGTSRLDHHDLSSPLSTIHAQNYPGGASGSISSASGTSAAASGGLPSTQLNQGNAPILATAFTDVFQVWSAKKFPGVIESTDLSRKFAAQGIKIPIRKDTKGGKKEDDGGDSDDDGDD